MPCIGAKIHERGTDAVMPIEPPVVLCPGCQTPMIPADPQPSTVPGLVEITYTCRSCGASTTRTVKAEGK